MQIKVLHLISSPYGFGGAEKLLLDMDEFYDRERFSVHYCNLFTSSGSNSLFSKFLTEKGLPKIEVAGDRFHNVPRMVSRLHHLIQENEFDVVHTHLLHAGIIGGILGTLGKRHRTVVTQHYTQEVNTKFFLKQLDQRLVHVADRLIAISAAVKHDLMTFGVPESKIRIIPNGISLGEFDKAAAKENSVLQDLKGRGRYIIGSVGNLHKRKDHYTLICAVERIVKTFPEVHLVIAGEGPERPFLEKTIAEKDLGSHVSLLGYQPNIASMLEKFDLYVHPSAFEPFGIAILEAFAARRGVIATEVEGVVDIIANGVDGILIPPGNPEKMADAIFKAIASPSDFEEMGKRGRKKIEEHFRIEKVVEKYQDLYLEI